MGLKLPLPRAHELPGALAQAVWLTAVEAELLRIYRWLVAQSTREERI